MLINPYANVDFENALRIQSISHAHTKSSRYTEPEEFEFLYGHGIRHFGVSNYHPSSPRYPLADYWPDMPDDAVECPNAEYNEFKQIENPNADFPLHANCIGGTLEREAMNVPWPTGFREMLNTLIVPDGGGITINHPYYSRTLLTTRSITDMLDYDPRVLGIEIINLSSGTDIIGMNQSMWDDVLKTGRRCWGFGVPDWEAIGGANWRGRNILFVPEATKEACLRAYRNGEFYVAYYGTGLTFENITVSEFEISVQTNSADSIDIIVDGVRNSFTGKSASMRFSHDPTYARVEAIQAISGGDEERIFSQPFMKSDITAEDMLIVLSES